MHRAAFGLAQAGGLAHELGEAFSRRRTAGHGMVMAPVGGEHVVIGPQRGTGTYGYGLMAGREVGRPLDQALEEEVVSCLLGAPDQCHLLVEAEELLRSHSCGRTRGSHWMPSPGSSASRCGSSATRMRLVMIRVLPGAKSFRATRGRLPCRRGPRS